MPTTVAEMTSQDLKAMEHQRHLASLYAEFATSDLALAKAGISDYINSLAQEDNARQNMV